MHPVDDFAATLDAARRVGVEFADVTPPAARRVWQVERDGRGEDDAGDGSRGGFELSYVDWGDDSGSKPALIFLHGFLQQARSWDFTCLALRSRFRCVSLDFRGHGDSGMPMSPDYTTHDYLSDLERLIRHLAEVEGVSRFGLCGLSLGGQLSYIYAARNPDVVDAIVVVDVAPQLNREARRGISRYISALPKDGPFDALVDKVARMSPMRNREAVRGSLRRATRVRADGGWEWKHDPRLFEHHRTSFTSEELWQELGGVTAPTLFVLGRNSKLVSTDVVRRMVETVAGSSASYVPNASHRVPGDNPVGFLRAVSPFLTRYVGG